MADIATRVYNHTWKIDPIVRSVLDTDFYKLLMAQTIFRRHRGVQVTFGIHNRTTRMRLADLIDAGNCASSSIMCARSALTRGESTWLRGNTFYGKRQMFSPEFMDWLEAFRFPEYLLEKEDGQYVLTFHGPWIETTMWEIPALAILNELRSRGVLKGMGKFELQVLYARAMTRVWEKMQSAQDAAGACASPISARVGGTASCGRTGACRPCSKGLGSSFLGTSNCLIALRREVEAVGTNAHELPMVYAALAESDAEMAKAPYRVLKDWQEDYEGNLRVILPDTYGTANFLANAPDWVADWTGIRIDSKDPIEGGEESIDWWPSRGQDPQGKACNFLRWSGCGCDQRHPSAFSRPRAARLRLGHFADQ